MIQKCNKCGSSSLFTEQKGSNIGLYCRSCGSWQKWLNKNEARLFSENNKVEGSSVHVDDGLRDRLEEFVQALDDMIDKEFSKEPIMSDGTLWEVLTALYFRWTCLPDCAVPELDADYRRNNRRLS